MKYLLYTDIVSYLADKNSPFHEPVREKHFWSHLLVFVGIFYTWFIRVS